MPHSRPRHLKTLLKQALSFSPIVGLLGHRQVGKTTLAEELGSRYQTLDLASVLDQVIADPSGYLARNTGRPLVLDECQLAPTLFPALKEAVRKKRSPGQYLLTGSVRFTSRKLIRESLTGRIVTWELLPMDLAETRGKPLPKTLPKLFAARTLELDLPSSDPKSLCEEIERYLKKGGLPGVFTVRNPSVLAQRFETQLETLLDRDLRLVSETTLSYRAIRQFAVFLANGQGQPFQFAEAMRATRISVPTLRKLLIALEAIFLVRVIASEGGEKRPVIFLEDQGEATHLRTAAATDLQNFERFLYANLRTQWMYRPELGLRLTQYRTRGGAYVPFVLRAKGETALGIIPILEENPGPHALGSAASLLKRHSASKVLFVHPGRKDWILDSRQRVVGAASLL